MGTRIIQDVEGAAMILVHELEQPPTDATALAGDALAVAQGLATKLNLDHTKLGPFQLGWLFDLADHVIDALSETPGTGSAAAPTADATPAPSGQGIAAEADSGLNQEAQAPAVPPADQAAAPATEPAPTQTPAPPAADTGLAPADQSKIDDAIAKAQTEWGGEQHPTS